MLPRAFTLKKHFLFMSTTGNKKSIAYFVSAGAAIGISRWEEFRDVVAEEVRIRRNNCSTAIKNQYMSKLRNIHDV